MRIVVLGGWGQLGTDLAIAAEDRHELVRPRHAAVDVVDQSGVDDLIQRERPDAVINAAAFHKVELCEEDPQRAFEVNAIGALNVARASTSAGARSVFISTDYVFRGDASDGYREDDPTGSVNVYGVSKAAGESLVLANDPQALVVRGSGLFGHAGSSGKGGNFVETMLARARAGQPIQVVDDQRFSPTSTRDLAERLLLLLERRAAPGIYHATNSGSCSWYEFARRAIELAGLDADVTPRSTDSSGVRRPSTSILLDTRSANLGLPAARSWEDALTWYVQNRPAAS
jgi:dTDP-4-dehydrorhamnose reductase